MKHFISNMAILSIFVILAILVGERWIIYFVLLFIYLKRVELFVSDVYWNFVKLFFKAYPSLWQSSFHVLTGKNKGRAPFFIWVGQWYLCFQLEHSLILMNWMTVVFPFSLCCVDTNCREMYDALSLWSVYLLFGISFLSYINLLGLWKKEVQFK